MADFVKLLLNPNDKNFQGPMNYSPIPEQQEAQYTPIPTQKVPLDEAKRMLANWDAAMATRNAGEYVEPSNQKLPSIDVSALRYTAPQVQELESARNELQEAQELDRQSGSEGYEAKPNGIFDRLKGFGAAIIGKQGLQELRDFNNDFGERGIGAFTQRANNLMNDMARSPFSKFVDPTTVLGGQRTMVNDIDSYFNQQGLPALRSELLAQYIARLKTPIGQAEEWAKKTPEQQAAMKPYFEMKGTGGYTGVGAKNPLQAAQRQVVSLVNDGVPMQEALQQVSDDTGIPANEILYGAPARQPQPRNLNQALSDEAESRYKANPELYDNNKLNAYKEVYDEANQDPVISDQLKRQGSYQARNLTESRTKKQVETAATEYSKNVLKEASNFGAEYDNTLAGLMSLKLELEKPENDNMFGGWFNSAIVNAATSLGYTGDNEQEALAVFNAAMRTMHGTAARQIDPSGRLTDAEQKRIDSTIIDINKPRAYNLKMVEDTISRMGVAKAMNDEMVDMVFEGASPKAVEKSLDNKYYYIRKNPQLYVNPRLLYRYRYSNGQYKWNNTINDWVFEEVSE